MRPITTTIEIHRPVDEVFSFLTDLDNAKLWTVDLVSVRAAGPLGAGVHGTDVRVMGRKQVEMPWQVTRYEPPHAIAFTYGDPFPATATFTCEATEGGTRLTCDTTLRLKGLHRWLGPLIAREARKTDAVQFRKAKTVLEGGTRTDTLHG
jgi:uncharacterized protein YndB with AHSA1/START domain